jgi:FAD/FMN-containing dehydrogenase
MTQIVFEHLCGRAASIPVNATAFPHRRAGSNMLVIAQWASTAETDHELSWAREARWAMQPFCAAGRYVNYQSETGSDVVAAAYGPSHARLRQVKRRYDPGNVFHVNQNIEPADA